MYHDYRHRAAPRDAAAGAAEGPDRIFMSYSIVDWHHVCYMYVLCYMLIL